MTAKIPIGNGGSIDFAELLMSLNADTCARFRQAPELGKWPDGRALGGGVRVGKVNKMAGIGGYGEKRERRVSKRRTCG